jgi:hypothetical protein
MLLLASAPLGCWEELDVAPAILASLLAALQVPMTWQLVQHARSPRYLAYIPFGFGRALARGFGATAGSADVALQWLFRRRSKQPHLPALVATQSTAAATR